MGLVKHNNNSLTDLTALPSAVPTGKMTLLSTATASSSASLSFDSTYINSDYLIYKFEFINIHPANSGGRQLKFNLSIDNGSNYNVTKTTTAFFAYHTESGSASSLSYDAPSDLAQSTAYQLLTCANAGNDADKALSGSMTLFNPSSTTYVKHFIATTNTIAEADYSLVSYIAGYGNTTSAVNAINFKFDEGNIDSGQIKLYGLAN